MKQVILGLGSNTEHCGKSSVELLAFACQRLKMIFADFSVSSVYESKAMYVANQNNFYNMAAKGFVFDNTDPFVLLQKINEIEAEFGRDRIREIRFGPRSLDIDIEEFGELSINTEKLTVPHPRMQEREFVLIPMLEILNESADSKIREVLKKSLKALSPQGVQKCPEEIQVQFRNLFEGGNYGNEINWKSDCGSNSRKG